MDRRLMLLTLAAGGAGLAAGPVFAQTSAAGDAEMDHSRRTSMVGTITLQTATLALEKGHSAKVKEFATFEHDEQTTVAEIIKSMNMPLGEPDPQMTASVTKLKGLSGVAFDKAFVAGQIEGHEMLLKIQEDYLKVGKDLPTIAVTKLVRGMVKEHLVLLADLHKMVG